MGFMDRIRGNYASLPGTPSKAGSNLGCDKSGIAAGTRVEVREKGFAVVTAQGSDEVYVRYIDSGICKRVKMHDVSVVEDDS